MGNSDERIDIRNKANEKANKIIKGMKNLEDNILKEEIKKRVKSDKAGNENVNISSKNKKFNLNIFVYSDQKFDERIMNPIKQYNSKIFNWKIINYVDFSRNNTEAILKKCENDFEDNTFNNVVIIPVNSISDFENILEQDGKDILEPFRELNEEQQPFFLIIDSDENDFNENKSYIKLKYSEKEKNEFDYHKFNEEITKKIIENKRKECDFQLKMDFIIEIDDKISSFMEYISKLKESQRDFEIFVNNQLYYQYLYNVENFYNQNNSNFEDFLEKEIRIQNILQISLILYNINISEYNDYYKLFEISEVEISTYEFKKHRLNNILRKNKYKGIDKRNFNVIRLKHTAKNCLLRYTGYFHQLGDILFCDQINFYPAKINIAIGGYMGSGKSTLINTIFGEKRCLEGLGSSITNYVSQFSLKDYPINFYDFPGLEQSMMEKIILNFS